MRTKLATCALAGVLAVSGVAGAALVAPAVSYAATGDSTALDARVTAITQALSGLVTDGSITQAQADEVATTLAASRPKGFGHGGRGGPGGGRIDMAAAAEALGITEQELRTRTQAGSTLADVAEQEGVAEGELVDALVAAATSRLREAVADGRLTQAEADARAVDLEARITDSLDELCGPGGRGGRGGEDGGEDGGADGGEDDATPSTAPSVGTSSDA
jgi:hypothetical protein